MRANSQNVQQQEEQETRGVGEGRKKNSGKQTPQEICGRERDGAGYTVKRRWTLQGLSSASTTGTFRKESSEFEGGGFVVH